MAHFEARPPRRHSRPTSRQATKQTSSDGPALRNCCAKMLADEGLLIG